MPISLRPASEADLPTIVDISTAAFSPSLDAVTRHLFGDLHFSDSVRDVRIARKALRFHQHNVRIMVAVDDSSSMILGYAMWEVPQSLTLEDSHANKEPQQHEKVPRPQFTQPELDLAQFKKLRRILVEDAIERFGPEGTKDVWALDSLGVCPAHRRKGIGRMLLDWGVKEAARQNKECYLIATPAGLPLYKAAGFESVKILDIFGTPHVSMRKRP